jgi:hypothetical protein
LHISRFGSWFKLPADVLSFSERAGFWYLTYIMHLGFYSEHEIPINLIYCTSITQTSYMISLDGQINTKLFGSNKDSSSGLHLSFKSSRYCESSVALFTLALFITSAGKPRAHSLNFAPLGTKLQLRASTHSRLSTILTTFTLTLTPSPTEISNHGSCPNEDRQEVRQGHH